MCHNTMISLSFLLTNVKPIFNKEAQEKHTKAGKRSGEYGCGYHKSNPYVTSGDKSAASVSLVCHPFFRTLPDSVWSLTGRPTDFLLEHRVVSNCPMCALSYSFLAVASFLFNAMAQLPSGL